MFNHEDYHFAKLLQMKQIIIIIIVLFLFNTKTINAQQKYWVFLKDKYGSKFDPYKYFSPKSIERRQKHNLPLCDSSDFPISKKYKKILQNKAEQISSESRWLNALGISASEEQIAEIKKIDFVSSVHKMKGEASLCGQKTKIKLSKRQENIFNKQTKILETELFEEKGIRGKGVRIAVFDAGFQGIYTNEVFKHLIKNKQIIKTYDFGKNREEVIGHSAHGTMVLACIAGIFNNRKMGLATDAEYLLARTELRSENKKEEENWLQAMEWADKEGADIINSSIGYTYHRYFTEQMDGETSIVAKAAKIAAQKGIIVVCAAGNEGNKDWKIINTPADVEEVLTVGAINPFTMYKAGFSSFGPTADRRLKPNIVAPGMVITTGRENIVEAKGTSYSSALLSGFAACVLQLNTEWTNKKIINEIQKSANLYPYFDYAHGYGIPKASYFVKKDSIRKAQKSFEIIKEGNYLKIKTRKKQEKRKKQDIYKYLYYNIQKENGSLEMYRVMEVTEEEICKIEIEKNKGKKLNLSYKGYYQSIKIE